MRLTGSVFWILDNVGLAFNRDVPVVCRSRVLDPCRRHFREVPVPKLFLKHQFEAFLHILLDVANFVVLRRVHLVRIAFWLHQVPITNFAVVATTDAISRSFVVEH